MKKTVNILLIEDDEDDYFIIKSLLSKISYFEYNLKWISNIDDLLKIDSHEFDICIVDYYLGKNTALDVLSLLKNKDLNIPSIVLTGMNNHEKDIEVMNAGAIDYISKEKINTEKLERVIRYAIQQNVILNQYKIERNKFQKLFELNTDLIIILNSNFEVDDVNNQVLETLFIDDKQKLLGMKIVDLIASPDMFELLKVQKNIRNEELDLTFFNTTTISGIFSLTEIFDSNNLTECYQIIIKDVSEVAKAKNRLRNIEKINFSGKMAQTLAHEIRNPLTNINLSVSFLKTMLDGEEKYLDMVLKNSKKINEITTQFINNTKEIELKKETISVNSVIEKAVSLCLDRIQLKKITLERNYSSTIDKKIIADSEKLSIAISNIILNATEALSNSKTPKITVESSVENNKIILSITDNGKGISSEKITTIFEPFSTDKKSGIGVGLSSVYNIITLHDWDVTVNSELNKGTTFYINMNCI